MNLQEKSIKNKETSYFEWIHNLFKENIKRNNKQQKKKYKERPRSGRKDISTTKKMKNIELYEGLQELQVVWEVWDKSFVCEIGSISGLPLQF